MNILKGMIGFLVASCIAIVVAQAILNQCIVNSYGSSRSTAIKLIEIPRDVLQILSDIVLLLIPLPTVGKSRLPLKQKLLVAVTFATASM